MFVATNRLFVPADRAEEFEARFRDSMRTHLPGVPGLRRSTLLRPTRPDQPYVSVNEFDTEDDFRAWVASDSFKEAHRRDPGIARHVTGNAVETFHSPEDLQLTGS
ncbi:antibiotic biosynthesis monooxygenase [Saccharothrix longispora]|uniref:antibiotic biosynthesis monooxygenase family protein n=1 Tax=Saccharothrix longispora TaxID=33920 RepID=UPI0028FDBDAB|nr:antibiotic biosynthesis monooxygenase [Saccharothrix longispora]MBY8850721.1 antibiotic biosynthesis monooxygenase [Saccharothrix sp. MB29]MDU0288316.1 antibiotic biosynthesis monooxygenase [Saccharothrix longispora]